MPLTRRTFLQHASALACTAQASRLHAFAQAPAAIPTGPFQPTWESLRDHYTQPAWLSDNRLGIFIHWGLYAIPAHGNEWYAKHMYTSDVAWHTEHYGAPDTFGYKDFIPLFKAARFDPTAWAKLFREAGAGYVVPVAEHHDGFAMWDSDLTPWCAGKMGPNRDLLGELAQATRAEGLRFGCSFHRMEHHTFMYPAAGVPNDQFDPKYASFYGPPQPGDMNDGLASAAFQQDWLARLRELVTKYDPQLVYFDNGINPRAYDQSKLEFASFFYNHAANKQQAVTIVSKDKAYLAGSVNTFEKATRAPKWIYPGPWLSDDAISGQSWGYVDGMTYRSAADILTELIELTCKGGGLLLNISPMADGTIPAAQQSTLRDVGAWMKLYGAALNGTQPWLLYGEGPGVPAHRPADWAGGSSADRANYLPPRKLPAPTAADIRFTRKGDTLYAIALRPTASLRIASLPSGLCRIEHVTHVADGQPIPFQQTAEALLLNPPASNSNLPVAYAITGNLPLST